jgi:hypothetical protein
MRLKLLLFFILIYRVCSSQNYSEITGVIVDKETKSVLPFANVRLVGKSIGTITNDKGEFALKFPKTVQKDTLCFSFLGYESSFLPVDKVPKDIHVFLKQQTKILKTVVISSHFSALDLIKNAIRNIENNYSVKPTWVQSFYRQTDMEDSDTTEFAEAVLNIFKGAYHLDQTIDSVELIKGRVLKESGSRGSHLNGINSLLKNDKVKWQTGFLDNKQFKYYDYSLDETREYNGRRIYVISFDQKEGIRKPLLKGKIYLDCQTLAFVRLEYTMSPKGIKYWKWPASIRLLEKSIMKASDHWIAFQVVEDYENQNGKWYLKDIRSFRETDRAFSKKGYSCLYSWKAELVVTKIDTVKQIRNLDQTKILKPFKPLSLQIGKYDETFWGNYNVLK